ncbi:MAG: hypothetical protein MPW15_15670 [Candidatus Manganitrophus sp.]|nr:hypothetical protein [Candidatus Manganitrophus sp.]
MGSGNFFQQEFVNVDPDGPGGAGPEATIHTMLEGASPGKSFVQESFVLLSGQRPPTIQNNTPSPIVPPPSHTEISFRQSVKDNGFSTTASLDPGQDIHIHQQNASADPVNGQSGGLSFSNVNILPNRTGSNGAAASDRSSLRYDCNILYHDRSAGPGFGRFHGDLHAGSRFHHRGTAHDRSGPIITLFKGGLNFQFN